MRVRIWLHEGHDGGPGVEAWALDFLGFATWARSEAEVLAKVPERFAEYCAWRARHGVPVTLDEPELRIARRHAGDEILFEPDHAPATLEEIDLTIRLLAASRADLVAELERAAPAALDWVPPYRDFARWADWRTIRANLAHIANGETHYYLRNVGCEPCCSPADPGGDWREFLPRQREEALAALRGLRASSDLGRVRRIHGEDWSLRKALRWLVSHERLHAKSIARILREHRRVRTDTRQS